MTRRKHRPLAHGDSGMLELLELQTAQDADVSAVFDLEYRREVFHQAADRVRRRVKPRTWHAFWLTSVEGLTSADAAERLEMSVGAVHIARSRVLGRLRSAVREIEGDGDEHSDSPQSELKGDER